MNIRQVRKKIKSVSNVKKITKAMQLVSAIKMKKAQEQAVAGKSYRDNLEKIIWRLTSNLSPELSPLLSVSGQTRKKQLVILVSSNKGLCGAFNFNLFRFTAKEFKFEEVDFISIGKKAAMFVSRMGGKVVADFSEGNLLESVSAIFQTVLQLFLEDKYQEIVIAYNRFVNTIRYEPEKKVLLPVILEDVQKTDFPIHGEYVVEPSPEQIIDSLLRSFVEGGIRSAIIESNASEHSARMIAMKNATENAEDVIDNLIFLRNKIRQEKITYELLDMITAKTSVESS